MTVCSSNHYDVIIVGAGMVGASLACVLERGSAGAAWRGDFKVLLVEPVPVDPSKPPAQPSFDARSTVLSFGTVDYMRQLALWDAVGNQAQPIHRIHVSDQGRFGAVRLTSADQGVDALGYVLENRVLGEMLNKAVASAGCIELRSGVSVDSLTPATMGMQVGLNRQGDGTAVTANLVVLAEGGRSGLGKKLGISGTRRDYNQQAVIANVAFSSPHNNVAYERFTAKGPLALLPLPDHEGQHRAALVWTRPSDGADEVMALSDDDFLCRLQADFGGRLGEFTRVGQRHAYPLALVAAREQIRSGLVLLGNAAHSLHPVAGQGFNLAFRDTMRLAQAIIDAVASGTDPGDFKVLQGYLDSTLADQEKTTAFSDYMTRLFSTDSDAAVWARKFGLFSLDLILPLKKAFAGRAMGTAGRRVQLRLPG